MKLKVFKILLAVFLCLSTLSQSVGVVAATSTDDEVTSEDLHLSDVLEETNQDVSITEAQQDFKDVANHQTSSLTILDDEQKSDYIYLSDLPYESGSRPGWGSIQQNKDVEGGLITLKVNDTVTYFKKGMGAHATSYLIYNITDYKDIYTRLSTYVGVDYDKRGKSDGAAFYIWGASSLTGEWKQLGTSGTLLPDSNAYYFDIDVSEYNYVKLEARIVGSSASDHTVYGDLRLLKTEYDTTTELYSGVKKVSEYDKEISKYSVDTNYQQNKLLILQREFVNRIGYQNIQNVYKDDPQNTKAVMDWIFNDQETLQLFIEAGGYFSGTGYNALCALKRLYTAYHDDMDSLIYKKMLLATAAAYSKNITTFLVNYGGKANASDPVVKYEYFKKLYDDGRFIRKSQFESYPMELMRTVMDSRINDEEIFWLRDYIEKKYPAKDYINDWKRYNGYGYAKYVNTGYDRADFYDLTKLDSWNQKYGFADYGISYGENRLYRIWMFMEAGAICWGLSGIGMVVNEVQGIPAIGTYQPGHEAYLLYSVNDDGKGIWSISDNIGGWQGSFSRWGGTTATEHRLMLGWGQMDYNTLNSGNNTSYTLLAQNALNNYDSYLKSMYYHLISNSYEKGSAQHEEALNNSLECYDKNLDALYGLYKSYASRQANDEEWIELARTISLKYRYFPAPMVDLLKLIRPKISKEALQIELDILQNESLKLASKATSKESLQDGACRDLANALLGKSSKDLATFSFDGDNANTVMIDESYKDSTIQVRISLDGGHSWEKFNGESEFTTSQKIKLSDEQVAKITAENDIWVGLMGTDKNFVIDITTSTYPTGIYRNDNENRLIGSSVPLEYKKNNKWVKITNSTRFDGNQTVEVRAAPTGTKLASASQTYQFNQNLDTETQKYITIDRVHYENCSSEQAAQGGQAKNAFDGNLYTMWHTNWNGSDKERYITASFTEPLYLSAFDYVKNGAGNGTFQDVEIYASMDGKTWTLVGQEFGWANNSEVKKLKLASPVYTKYVRIKATKGVAGFATASIINFYEDLTLSDKKPVALEVTKQPEQAFDEYSYYDGERIDFSGMEVHAVYEDQSKVRVSNDQLKMNHSYASIEDPTIVISHTDYDDVKVTIPLKIQTSTSQDKVTGIHVEQKPEQLNYMVGDKLDLTGLIINKDYESGRTVKIDDYEILQTTLDKDGDISVTIKHEDWTTSFDVHVVARPVNVTVASKPKKVEYAIGDAFNGDGLKIVETYADESTKEFSLADIQKNYVIQSDNFSKTSGTQTITIKSRYDENLQTTFEVKVLSDFTVNGIYYRAIEHTNKVKAIGVQADKIASNGQIVIPDVVKTNGVSFTVVEMSCTDKYDFSNQKITSIIVPSTIERMNENIFKDRSDIDLYMTSFTSFSTLTAVENIYTSSSQTGTIYVSTQALKTELSKAIDSGQAIGLKGMKIQSLNDAVVNLRLKLMDQLIYHLGEKFNTDGFKVYAVMSNGEEFELNDSLYTFKGFDNMKAGEQEITVMAAGLEEHFKVQVEAMTPVIKKQPVGQLIDGYTKVELSVEASTQDAGQLTYQWYMGDENSYDLEPISNATDPTLNILLSSSKYLYVEITNNDTHQTEGQGTTVRSRIIALSLPGDHVAAIDGFVYETLQDAVDQAQNGDVITVLKDVDMTSTLQINKSIMLTGKHVLKRSGSFKNELIRVTNNSQVVINQLTLDGGAQWSGNKDGDIERSLTNTGLSGDRPLIIQDNGSLTLQNDATLQNNKNNGSYAYGGGAVLISGGELTFNHANIIGCENVYGGAVLSKNNSKVIVEQANITQNRATTSGGVFCVDHSSQLTINGGTIHHNKANSGGVIWVSAGTVKLVGGQITNNRTINDGTIYTSGNAAIYLSSTEFANNVAPKGQVIHYSNGSLKISGQLYLNDQNIYIYNNRAMEVNGKVITSEPVSLTYSSYNAGSVVARVTDEKFLTSARDAFVIIANGQEYPIYTQELSLLYGSPFEIEITKDLEDKQIVQNMNQKMNVMANMSQNNDAIHLQYHWYVSKNEDGSDAVILSNDEKVNVSTLLKPGTWYVWCVVDTDATKTIQEQSQRVKVEVASFYPGSRFISKVK